MRSVVAVVLSVLAVGCGGVSFAGTYKGVLDTELTCDDGSAVHQKGEATQVIEDTSSGVLWKDDKCGDFTGTVSSNTASLETRTCPPVTTAEGVQVTVTLKNGKGVLNGTALVVTFDSSWAIASSGGNHTCTGLTSGTLTK